MPMKTIEGYSKEKYTDTSVLLAGGGAKALSDFSMAHSHPYLPLAGGTMTGAINLTNTNAKLAFGDLSTSSITGYKAPSLLSNGVGIYSRYGGGSDEGAIIITEDTCVIYNSADTGWNFQVMDKDLGGDMTNDATRSFGINQNHQAWSLAGFVKSGSDDNYVLLGGGGHKLESNLSVNYATSAGRLNLTSCYNGTTNNDLWSTIKTSNSSYLGTATIYEVYNNGGPSTYGEVLDIVSVHSNHWQPQLWFDAGKGGRLRHRNKDYNDNSWGDWKTVAWTSDIPTKVSQLTNDKNYLTSLPSHNHDERYAYSNVIYYYTNDGGFEQTAPFWFKFCTLPSRGNGGELYTLIIEATNGGDAPQVTTIDLARSYNNDSPDRGWNLVQKTSLFYFGNQGCIAQITIDTSNNIWLYYDSTWKLNQRLKITILSTVSNITILTLDLAKTTITTTAPSAAYGGNLVIKKVSTAIYSNRGIIDVPALYENGTRVSLNGHNHNSLYITSLGTNGNYLTWTKNGSINNITVPYASNAETATRALYQGRDSFIQSPKGGTFTTSNSTYTGYLRIKLPCGLINTMMSFFVDIYDYSLGCSVTYKIAGYSYSGGWVNTTAQCVSSYEGSYKDLSVRFGTLDSKAAVEIGETDTSWSYPQVLIRDLVIGYSGGTVTNYFDGWTIDFNTTSITVSTYSGNQLHSYHANVGLKAKYANSAGNVAWGNVTGKPSTFEPSSHSHDYLPLSGGTMTGSLTVKQYIFGYNYNHAGGNAPAFVFDKPGSYYTGIGANGEADTIYFSAATISNGEASWVTSYKQKWKFNGTIYQENNTIIHSGNIGSQHVSYADSAGSAPASDVYDWAKQSTKPSYSFSEITPGVATIGDGANRLMFRTHESYRSGIYYSTPGNESMVFANKNSVTSWIFATTDPNANTGWTALTPSLQIKNGRVTINKLIANDTNAAYNLDVNGSANATTLYENGVRVSISGHTHSYLPLSGGWMDTDSQIYFKGANSSTSVYGTLGFRSVTPNGLTMHYTNAQSKALFLCVNGYDSATDNGGLAIDNDCVTVFGAGDTGSVFRVIDEDIYNNGPIFLVNTRPNENSNGNVTIRHDGYVSASGGFIKSGSDDNYVLLGGGGHKSVSNFVQTSGDQSISGTKTFSGTIKVNRAESTTGFFLTSDFRKKNILGNINEYKAYDFVKNCKPIVYELKDDETHDKQLGLIAQEVEEYFPELVITDENGFKSMDYSRLSVVLFALLKDLMKRNKL